jgi:hypothetical protein
VPSTPAAEAGTGAEEAGTGAGGGAGPPSAFSRTPFEL